jgi:HK97 family phage major capsid protein
MPARRIGMTPPPTDIAGRRVREPLMPGKARRDGTRIVYSADEVRQGIARDDIRRGNDYSGDTNAPSGSGLRSERIDVALERTRIGNSLADYDALNASRSAAARDAAEGYDKHSREVRAFNRYLRVQGAETRDLSTASNSGGYLIPFAMQPEILFGVRYASAFLGSLRLWESTNPVTGRAFGGKAYYPMITSDADNGVSSAAIGDNTQVGNNDPVLSQIAFPQAPAQSLELFRISRMLLEDSAVDILSLVTNAAAQRMARFADSLAVTNLLAAATLNQTTASSATVVYSDVVNWLEKLSDISIMGSPTSCIVVSPSTLAKFRLMADSSLRPIMGTGFFTVTQDNDAERFGGDAQYSRTVRVPTLLGTPVLTSNALAAFAGGAVVGIAGDLQQAGIFRFVEASVQPLFERYGDFGQVAYLGYYRCDVQAADANAFATLTIHA